MHVASDCNMPFLPVSYRVQAIRLKQEDREVELQSERNRIILPLVNLVRHIVIIGSKSKVHRDEVTRLGLGTTAKYATSLESGLSLTQ